MIVSSYCPSLNSQTDIWYTYLKQRLTHLGKYLNSYFYQSCLDLVCERRWLSYSLLCFSRLARKCATDLYSNSSCIGVLLKTLRKIWVNGKTVLIPQKNLSVPYRLANRYNSRKRLCCNHQFTFIITVWMGLTRHMFWTTGKFCA